MMDLTRKLEIVTEAVASITGDTDVDSTVRLAALDATLALVEAAKKTVAAESAAAVAALGAAAS
jgi:uncharacterized protein (UPF0147 family)